MEILRLGDSEIKVSQVCLGTMTWGEQNTEAEAHAQLNLAADRGVTFIDTAEMYPVPGRAATQGSSEAYLGSWLQGQARDRFVIATKVIGKSGMDWIRGGGGLDRTNIRAAIESSLQRLGTDYIDLYQLHWPDRYVPKFGMLHYNPKHYRNDGADFAETLDVMAELIREGKVRAWGLSNETPYGVAQFVKLAEQVGAPKPVSIQNAYSLLNRLFDIHLVETCHHEQITLLPYSVLAFGFLTGKYRNGALPEGSRATRFPGFAKRYRPQTGKDSYAQKPNMEEAIDAYTELAGDLGLTAMALQFVHDRPFAKSVIVGATSVEQLEENLDALEGELPSELLRGIEQIHQRFPNPCP